MKIYVKYYIMSHDCIHTRVRNTRAVSYYRDLSKEISTIY